MAVASIPAADHPWLRRRSRDRRIDVGFLGYWLGVGAFVGVGVAVLLNRLPAMLVTDYASLDASLYYHATEAWLQSADPWAVRTPEGIYFAGLPTTLLLSAPLLPFGPLAATWFWVVADVVGWIAVVRRLQLGPWWLLFPPFVEALTVANPDPALAGLVVVGGGVVAGLLKPYAIPAMLGEGRWRAVAIVGLLGIVTIPLLPWGSFVAQSGDISAALEAQSFQMSAWGNPVLMMSVVVSLVLLGPRLALLLATPTLWPLAQFHYSVFSARAGTNSAFLGLALAVPRAVPFGVVVYAIATRLWPLAYSRYRARRGRGKP